MPDRLQTASAVKGGDSHAQEFWKTGGEQSLSMALRIVNDVVDFEVHGAYLAWTDSELVWTYETGEQVVVPEPEAVFRLAPEAQADMQSRLDIMRRWEKTHRKATRFKEWNAQLGVECEYILIRIETGGEGAGRGGHGIVVVGRTAGADRSQEFSVEELHILNSLATVLTAALGGGGEQTTPSRGFGRRLLRRLDTNRLHLNHRLQDLDVEQILRVYLFKAADLCHELPRKAFADGPPPDPGQAVVRLTAKVVNDNGAALHIVECLSTDPRDWTPERKAHRYPLAKQPRARSSFAARAFTTRRPTYTHAYENEVPKEYLIFPGVACHMSIPILEARPGRVYGILSVETTDGATRETVYTPTVVAAMVLLAAHAAVPLRHAIARREHELLLAEYDAELEDAEVGLLEEVIRDRFLDRLRKRGYWPRVASTTGAASGGGTAYKIADRHGHPLWTVSIVRADGAPLTDTDYERIRPMARRAVQWRDRSRLVMAEGALFRELTRNSFSTLGELLCKTANVVTGKDDAVGAAGRVVARARVFVIEQSRPAAPGRAGDLRQCPVHQAGDGGSAKFMVERLDRSEDQAILKSKVPILFVRKGASTPLTPCAEYDVRTGQPDHHESNLNSVGRTQWVEIPVWHGDRVAAKLVLDHFDPARDRAAGASDGFTAGEMMFVARLSRLLSAWAVVADAYKAIFHLCAVGVHARLYHHSVKQFVTISTDKGLQTFVAASQQYLHQAAEVTTATATDIKELLDRVIAVCGCFPDIHKISSVSLTPDVPAGLSHTLTPSGKASLLLILATLIDNACRHVAVKLTADPKAKPRITVWARQDPRGLLVGIDDTGSGVAKKKARLVRERLAHPSQDLFQGEVHGLSLASFLAKWEQWTLELHSLAGPTSIRIVIPNVGS